jgi:hypothetical protein
MGYCTTGILRKLPLSLIVIQKQLAYHFSLVTVSKHGAGNHQWEVTQDGIVMFMKVSIELSSPKTNRLVLTSHTE